jgi:RNA polymerase sigma factor (TIGR02999 family)
MRTGASVTEQLQSFMCGSTSASEDLMREILPKLRQVALNALNRERYAAPFSQTELIHELWIGSLAKGGWHIRDRGHFYALASLSMRRILTDFARKRLALRRGGGAVTCSFPETAGRPGTFLDNAEQIVAIGILMDRLESNDPVAARMVDMHYFSGFTLEEIAHETGLSVKQVRLRWERGLKWLKSMLQAQSPAIRGSRIVGHR